MITIYAIACRKNIASDIIKKKADIFLELKRINLHCTAIALSILKNIYFPQAAYSTNAGLFETVAKARQDKNWPLPPVDRDQMTARHERMAWRSIYVNGTLAGTAIPKSL